jgi:hypothetical protein
MNLLPQRFQTVSFESQMVILGLYHVPGNRKKFHQGCNQTQDTQSYKQIIPSPKSMFLGKNDVFVHRCYDVTLIRRSL